MYIGIEPTVNAEFVKDLRTFDPKLRADFNRAISRFIIVRDVPGKGTYNIWIIEGEDGSFRQPDQRDIKALYYADTWNRGGIEEFIRKGEERILAHKAAEEKRVQDDLRDITKDDKLQLRRTFRQASGQGKANAEFERKDIKGPGLTVTEIRQARAEGRDPWEKIAKVA